MNYKSLCKSTPTSTNTTIPTRGPPSRGLPSNGPPSRGPPSRGPPSRTKRLSSNTSTTTEDTSIEVEAALSGKKMSQIS